MFCIIYILLLHCWSWCIQDLHRSHSMGGCKCTA